MQRETTIIKVGVHSVEVKTYVTARESNLIQQAYFRGSKVEMVGSEPKFSELNPNVQYEVKLEMIRQMVVRIDGEETNLVSFCEDLPDDEFQELTTILDDIIAKKKLS